MQNYDVIFPTQVNAKDILCYLRGQTVTTPYYIVHTIADANVVPEVDVLIYSAHQTEQHVKNAPIKNKLAVISYVPKQYSEEWLPFYTAIYYAGIIACDSLVYNELKTSQEAMLAKKVWVNLDGAVISNDLGLYHPDVVEPATIHFIGSDRVVAACTAFANSEDGYLHTIAGVKPIDDPIRAQYVISFDTLGYSISNALTRAKQFVWIPSSSSSVFLDTRYTHPYAGRITNFASVVGGASGKMFKDAFEELIEEFITLALHINTTENPPVAFDSNVTIFDRIFHELNRSVS